MNNMSDPESPRPEQPATPEQQIDPDMLLLQLGRGALLADEAASGNEAKDAFADWLKTMGFYQ